MRQENFRFEPSEEPQIMREFQTEEGKRRRVRKSISTVINPTTGKEERHLFEVTYEEIMPDVWQKVYGTQKDFGIV